MPSKALRRLVEGALIAAMYAALTLAVPAASFGLAQLRVAEMLTVLPVFTPAAVPGLAVGCVVSNMVGLAMGANLAGAWDILLGSLATLVSAVFTYVLRDIKWRGLPALATLPPVLLNAVVVGLELTWVLFDEWAWSLYLFNALQVGVGQLVACTACGLILYTALDKSGAKKVLFG